LPERATPVKGFNAPWGAFETFFYIQRRPLSNPVMAPGAFVIAVDGPAASGKGTLAKAISRHFGYPYLDTGALYRGTGIAVLRQGGDPANRQMALEAARSLDAQLLDDPALRTAQAGSAASIVAAIPEVRAALLQFQRDFAAQWPGSVLDGRDIGTIICPDAPAKLFVTASLAERARRRHLELSKGPGGADLAAVVADLAERDLRDSTRSNAPLARAHDADLLDTTELSIEAAIAAAIDLISRKHRQGAG
jgi:cytidylate kinase